MAVSDIFSILLIALALGIVILVAFTVLDQIDDKLIEKLPAGADNINTVTTGFRNVMDSVFTFIVIGSGVGAIVLAFMTESHPVFAFIGIVLVGIALLIAPTFSNVFETIGQKDIMSTAYDAFPMQKAIMENLPVYILVIGLMIAIVTYGKIKSGMSR